MVRVSYCSCVIGRLSCSLFRLSRLVGVGWVLMVVISVGVVVCLVG